jgi:phosphohistidine phosphatase
LKTLYLLRHAKSDWADAGLPDHDRPLARRGEQAAKRIATYIEHTGIRPELVLCSSARRARDTLEAMTTVLGQETAVRVEDELYGAGAPELLGRLWRVGADTQSVMMVGHNPGLHDLAAELAGDGDGEALAQLQVKFPTGALATLTFAGPDWRELAPAGAHLAGMVVPRQLQ